MPTFGALYLATTFLFPFVAIRTIGAEKQNGGQKLLLQMPYRTATLIAVKLGALAIAWAAMALPCLSAVIAWVVLGGHVSMSEVAILLLGYFFYSAVIAGLSLVAAALADAAATAAIITLSFTLGFWVLDFAAAGQGGLLNDLAALSLTAVLHSFERGILSLGTLLATAIALAGLATLAGVLLPPGRTLSHRAILSIATVSLTVLGLAAAGQICVYADATENRRNSFPAADVAALAALHNRLTIIVNLASEDPRFIDFERGVLGKLRRTMPKVEIVVAASRRSGLFSASAEAYGQIIYRYGGLYRTRSYGRNWVMAL